MIPHESSEIAKVVSSSIAPVFLITGIAAILSIMSLRYGRVIDRIRTLLRDGPKLYRKEIGTDHLVKELGSLYHRARLLRLAIIIEVLSICFISLSIFMLFFGMGFGVEIPFGALASFIASLVFLLIGLLLFIRDFAMSLECIEHDMNVRSSVDMEALELAGRQPLSREHKQPTSRFS